METPSKPNLVSVAVRWCCSIHGVTDTPGSCVFCRQAYGGHSMCFEALFKSPPSQQEVADAQIAKGYHPAGYGGPSRMITAIHPAGHRVTWYCSDNCE